MLGAVDRGLPRVHSNTVQYILNSGRRTFLCLLLIGPIGSRRSPEVFVMEPTHAWDLRHPALTRRLHAPWRGRVPPADAVRPLPPHGQGIPVASIQSRARHRRFASHLLQGRRVRLGFWRRTGDTLSHFMSSILWPEALS